MFRITSVRTQKLEGTKLVGLASIVIDRCFAINDIRIIKGNGEKGLFVAFPSRKQMDGEFKDICHPINSQTREMFEDVILTEFKKGDDNEDNTTHN